MIGQTISHYRITGKLGEGGMGVVYLAEDTVLGRQVAIKTLTDGGAGKQQFRTRFLREARAVSALSHSNIATIHDYGETPAGQPYIVMEFVKGQTLADLINQSKLTLERALEIIIEVAKGLGEAHRCGIIHRDIKPTNVAINERGQVKVLDFGLAKQIDAGLFTSSDPERQTLLNTQTREGVIVGTPMYLSPEQALGIEVDVRSDLFSLGSLLYECIAGTPPFLADSAIEICAKVIREDPLAPSRLNSKISIELDQVTLKALAKQPEARYQTAAEMILALQTAREHLTTGGPEAVVTRLISPAVGTRPSGTLGTLSDIFKRPRLSIGYVVAVALVVIIIVSLLLWLARGKLHVPTLEAQQLYEKGVGALQEGAYHKASKMFERAIAADDKFALAHARLAEAYTALDYTDKAKDELLSVSRLVTDRSLLDPADALYLDAITATVTRDLPGAIDAYNKIAQAKSTEAHVYLDLGRAYEDHDDIDKAIEQYLKASSLDRNNPAPFLRIAVLYGRRQGLADSNTAFDKAESLYKDNENFEGSAEVSYQRGYLLSQMGKVSEARSAAQQSLDVAKLAGNNYQQVRALLLQSGISYSSGETTQAQQLATQALALAKANDLENLATQGLLDLGNALLLQRSYERAEPYLKQGLDLAQRYKEKRNEARANLLLGTLHIQQEQVNEGAPFIDQALAFFRTGGYRREVSRCMIMIGREQLLKGDFATALKTLDEQLELAKQVEDPGQLAKSQAECAAALSKQDLYPQALVRYTESYILNKQLKNPLNAAYAVYNRGDMLARLGRYEEAIAAMGELNIYLDGLSNDNSYKKIWGSWSHLILARMYLSQRRLPAAKEECGRAAVAVAGDDLESQAEIKATQGLIEIFAGQTIVGRKLVTEAQATLPETSDLEHRGSVSLFIAEALLEAGDAKGALGAALQAQDVLSRLHETEHEWRAWLFAGRASESLGNQDAMRDQFSQARYCLDVLQQTWGSQAFESYSGRADIKVGRKQIA